MTTAEAAARPLLPELPARATEGPGQFAFADPGRVRSILEAAGWRDAGVERLDVACTLPEADLIPYLTGVGPVSGPLREADADTRARLIDALRLAFDRYVEGGEVRFIAACWMVTATG